MKEYQLNSPIDMIGGFWPPDNQDDITSGTLSSHDGRLYLSVSPQFKRLSTDELRDSLMAFNPGSTQWQRIKALQGQTKDGRCTLLDLIESMDDGLLDVSNSLQITASRWRVGTAVMGLHIESDEADVLDGAAFYITKIKNMLPPAGGFQMTQDAFTYISPLRALRYFSFSSIPLEAEIICEIFSRGGTRRQSVPRIRIIPRTPKSLAWYWIIGPRLENFFSLILGTSVSLKRLQVFQGEQLGWLVKRFQSRQEKVNYQNWIRCEGHEMAAALAMWLAVPDERRPVEKVVLNVLRKSSLFVETEFLGLAQGLEGFGRLRFEGASAKKLTFARGIEQTYDLLSLNFATTLLGERSQLVRQIVQTRNHFTHLGISKKASVVDDGKELFLLNQRLHAFLRCVMLIDIGIPEAALREPILYQSTRWK